MDIQDIEISKIRVSDLNTRKDLQAGTEDSSIHDLAESIRQHGLLSPVTVRPLGDGTFELLAGQRRFLACSMIGLESMPAIISDVADEQAVQVSLIENVHRADLHPLDKARAFQALSEYHEGNVEQVSRETGVGVPTIKKYLAVLQLPDSIKAALSTSDGPARIETLYALTRTFDSSGDIESAYRQISGFSQNIQTQILRESGGDIDLVPGLVLQAQAGAFQSKICRGLQGKLMCEYIPTELAQAVIGLVEDHRLEHAADEPDWKRKLRELADAGE